MITIFNGCVALTVLQLKPVNKNMNTKTFIILVLTLTLFLSGYYLYQNGLLNNLFQKTSATKNESQVTNNKNSTQDTSDQITVYTLPEGDQAYTISHGKTVQGPKATNIVYSPLNIKTDSSQTITVTFPKGEAVNSAIVYITTDNQQDQKVTLAKSQGKEDEWTGTWTPTDTITKTYNARLYFVGPTGTYNNVMTFL